MKQKLKQLKIVKAKNIMLDVELTSLHEKELLQKKGQLLTVKKVNQNGKNDDLNNYSMFV